MIQVSVVGAKGRMCSHVVDAVNGAEDMQLALALDAGDDLTRIEPANTDVVVEFTVPSVSLGNVLALIAQRQAPNHGVGRAELMQALSAQGVKASDVYLRKLLAALVGQGLAEVGKGRQGTRLTEKGLRELEKESLT